MATNVIVLQHNHTGNATYPFTDYSTLTSTSGITLAGGVFIDANLYPIGGGVRQYVSGINVSNGVLTVEISDGTRVTCSGTLNVSSGDNQLVMKDTYGRLAGILVGNSEPGKFLSALPEGELLFNSDALEFVASCVSPQPQIGVEGVLMEDGTLLSGDVWLVGKDGVILQWDETRKAIVLHLVGDPLFRKRNCDNGSGTYQSPTPLQALTFVTDAQTEVTIKPDEYGNIRWVSGSNQSEANVLRVETTDNGIRLRAIGNIT
jgi:hypothetical protein